MNKLILSLVLIASLPALALQRSDLSAEAEALLPDTRNVTVVLQDGSENYGEVIEQNDQGILLEISRGSGIKFQKRFAAADIKAVEEKDAADLLAVALLGFKDQLEEATSKDELESTAALFKEFLDKADYDHRAREAVKALYDDTQFQLGQIARGLEKIDGEWLPPVQGTILRYDKIDERIREMEAQFPGIDNPSWDRNPRARAFYDRLVSARRETARQLPRVMAERLPILLDENSFNEAAEELTAFQSFFLNRVAGSEAGPQRMRADEARIFDQMDIQYFFRMQDRILEKYNATQPDQPAPELDDTSEMVEVPAGFFIRGDKNAPVTSDTFPALITYVDAFRIDRYEVSNAEYREFLEYVESTGDSSMEHPDAPPLKNHRPAGWDHPDLSADNQPVVGVDWYDAYAYAKWKGKRLPTEAEWERAARGSVAAVYPWGEQTPAEVFANNTDGRQALERRITSILAPPPGQQKKDAPKPRPVTLPAATWPVNELLPELATRNLITPDLPGVSPYGVYHMAGNAAEWVQDFYDQRYYYNAPVRNPQGPESGDLWVYRGGSYLDDANGLTTFHRMAADEENTPFGKGRGRPGKPLIGFRCAQ